MSELGAPAAVPAQAQNVNPTPATPPIDFKGTKHKVKIDGKEYEWDYDRVLAEAQKGYSSSEKWKESARIKQQVDEILTGLSKKDINVFKRLANSVGEDAFQELAEQFLLEKIEYNRLPEPERKRMEAERRAEAAEKALQDKDKEANEAYRQQAKNTALQEIDSEIGEALKLYQGKVTPRLVARIVERMMANLSATNAKLPASEAAKIEFAEMREELKEYLPMLSPDELRSILPKNLLDGLRKADLDLARGQFAPARQSTQKEPAPSNKRPKKMSSEEFFKSLERKLG